MQRIVVVDKASAADSPAASSSVAAATVASLEAQVAGTTDLGRPGDKMTAAALNCIVVDIAAATPAMVVDTSAAGGMVVVGTVVTCWLLLCTASIPIYLVLS